MIPGGLLEKVSDLSTAPRHLVDQSSLISCFWCFSSSTTSRHMICRRCFSWHLFDRCLDATSTPHLSRFTNGLYILLVRSAAHFYWSFSRYLCLFTSQTFLTHSNPLPLGFSSFFQVFLHLLSFWSPSFTCISCFKT